METESIVRRAAPLAALSIEFVARPEEVDRLHQAIPEALREGLGEVPGFAGSLVMISDREARLVSVVTFWGGAERITSRSKRAPWVRRILEPYADHCLRTRTLDAYLPGTAFATNEVSGKSLPGGIAFRPEEEPLFCLG